MSSNTIAAKDKVEGIRTKTDSLGTVDVPADRLWGAQTQRSVEHFRIGKDLILWEMIAAYATLKKAGHTAESVTPEGSAELLLNATNREG